MSKVITFSRFFPKYHPRAGQQTFFVEKIYSAIGVGGEYLHIPLPDVDNFMYNHDENYFEPKLHTIRAGNRFKVGEKFSPRVWSGKPYASKQIIIADDIEVKHTWDFKIVTEDDDGENDWSFVEFLGKQYTAYGYGGYDDKKMVEIAKNDGLEIKDFYDWFLTGRTKNQRINNESKIFNGQIICWGDVSY